MGIENWVPGPPIAAEVEVEELPTATYDDVQDYINFFGDRTTLSGGGVTDNGDGSAAIAAGTAWCKETDSDAAVGRFFDFSANSNVSLTDLITSYLYVDYNDGTPQIVVSADILTHGFKQDHIHIATIFRNGTTLHFHEEDTIGIGRINRVDMRLLELHDAERASGLVTSDGGSLALSITAGVIYEGINRHLTTVDGSTWSTWYTSDGGTTWTEVTGQSALDNTQYNDTSSGLSALTANRYAVHWVYVDIDGENLFIVYGQGNYTANQAEEAGVPALLPDIAVNYGVLIAKIIVQKDQTALTISYPWTTVFTSSLATDHGSLGGLLDDDHTQYTTDARAVSAVEAAGLTFAADKGLTLATDLADSKYQATEMVAGTAGASLTFGDLVYFAVGDSKWELADADAASTSKGLIGICVLTASEDAATTILLRGMVRADTPFPTLTIGAPVHVGLTAGDVQVAAPSATGDIVRIIGYGITGNQLFFCPDNTYVEIT